MIQKLIEPLWDWKVVVTWENQTFTHRATGFTDALGWMACAVYRNGKLWAVR